MNFKFALKTIFFLLLALSLETMAFAYTAADYANAGLQVYNQKNYALAIRYYTAALALEPSNTQALQGRANCYYYLAQYPQALADYQKLQAQNPSGPVSQFIQALQAKIGTSGTAPAASAATPTSGVSPTYPTGVTPAGGAVSTGGETTPTKPAGLGLLVEPSYMIVNLNDFNTDAQTRRADAPQSQVTDPTYTYDATVPTSYVGVAVELAAKLGSGLEIGLPFAILPVGKVFTNGQDALGYSEALSYDISGFSIGLIGRYVFGSGPVRPFVSAGGLLVPIAISYNDSQNYPPNTTKSISGSFSGMAFGGQVQAGVDFHVGEPFVLSLFGGYQTATANSFKGTLTESGSGPTTTSNGQLVVYADTNGKKITFLNDSNPLSPNFRPLQIDLSGIMAGVHLSVYF